jgi:hypothetical protein
VRVGVRRWLRVDAHEADGAAVVERLARARTTRAVTAKERVRGMIDSPGGWGFDTAIMPAAATNRAAVALVLAATLVSCGRGPVYLPFDGPTVDADVYALGFCSLKCYRLDQCGLAGGTSKEACEQTCVDEALETLPGDPCWAEQIELRRCVVRETTCDGVADEELPAGSEAVCAHRQRELDACGP